MKHSRLVRKVNNPRPHCPCPPSHTSIALRHLRCIPNVVYSFMFSCGKSYIGETGKCIKARMLEHINAPGGHVLAHKRSCRCTIVPRTTKLLKTNVRDGHLRKLIEGY